MFREFLSVGALATAAGRMPCQRETEVAARRLREAPCEQQDGSTRPMPALKHEQLVNTTKGY